MVKKTHKTSEMDFFDFSLEPGREKSQRMSIDKGLRLISVITVYDGVKEKILQTAQALFNQTFPNYEWIIINNTGEIDEYISQLYKLQKKDSRIKIYDKKTQELSAARIYAANMATTDIVFLLDADDLIDVTMLECGYFAMYTNPDVTWVYSRTVDFGYKQKLHNKKLTVKAEKRANIIPSSAFIKKDKFLEIIEYKNLPKEVHEDWYMWLYFLSKGYEPLKMNFYGFWHRSSKKEKSMKILQSDKARKISMKYLNSVANKIDINTEIIQFENSYDVDYVDVPQKICISKKSIFNNEHRKRILFILPYSVIGGAEIFNFNLIKGLRKIGYEISIITTKKCDYSLRQSIESWVDEYFDLTTFLKRKHWPGFIYHIIKTRKIDCVFISNSYYGYYVLPWLKYNFKKIPFVDYIHAENLTLRNGGFPKDSNAVSNYLDKTFTCTKYLKNIMYENMNRDVKNIKEVYIGTDADFYNPDIKIEGEDELIEKYKGKHVIFLPCRVTHYKRPLFAIKVIEKIIKKRKDIVLIIAGDGVALDDTKEYIKEKNLQEYVECIGMQKELRHYYKIASATLVCSLREGLTLTTYESLSMGVPVISANIGGQQEIIEDDCGILIKPYQAPNDEYNHDYSEDEIKEYEEAIYKIINNKNIQEMKHNCRSKVIKNFTINKMVDTIDKEITRLIESGSMVDENICNNIELAERYLLVHSVLESKEEIENKK